jgi:hypothetical protein
MTKTTKEEDVYGLLHFAEACRRMPPLERTATTAEELHKSLANQSISYSSAADLLLETFQGQLGGAAVQVSAGYWQLKRLFEDLRDKLRTTRRQEIKLFEYRDFERVRSLDENLGIIYDELTSSQGTPNQRYLLLCLGHVIRWEVRAREVEQQLERLAHRAYMNQEEKVSLVAKDYLTIRKKGSDGEPDTKHLRNSIAHGRFRFMVRGAIEFEDRDMLGKTVTFSQRFSFEEFGRFCDLFEVRLRLLPLYVEFHNVMVTIARHHFGG